MTKVPFSKPMFYSKSKLTLAIAAQMLVITPAWTAPTGGEIVGGTGSIEQQGTETTIVQNTDRLAIDWQGFDVGKNERVKFVQPGQSAVALNRILGNKGSEILGRIDANGHVILVNPNGVVFGQGAVVNAGGLIASGLQINPDDFMNGDLAFKRIEGADGTIINSGMINAAAGGNVVLLGKQVENRGLISARLGSVLLASGEEAVLTFDESGLLGVQVDKATLQNEIGSSAAVANSGEIRAENGRVLLSAATTRNVFSQAVNWGEHRQAQSVAYNEDGSFTLGAGGDVINSGAISTSGEGAGDVVVLGENITLSGTIHADAVDGKAGYVELHSNGTTIVSGRGIVTANGEQGGDIKLLGKNVGLMDRSAVEAMGTAGGGVVLVGGDREGLNSRVRNSDFVYINKDAFVNVSATDDGDGGTAIIFAEDTARVYGSLSSRGGKYVGNGGFIETSGKRGFEVSQTPDIGAVNGEGGHWLIDPYNITIGAGGEGGLDNDNVFESTPGDARIAAVTIVKALADGATVTIKTGDPGEDEDGKEGDITIATETHILFERSGETATLNLIAHNNIIFNDNTSITARKSNNSVLNVNLNANTANNTVEDKGAIRFGSNTRIETGGGDFVIGEIDENGVVDPKKSGAHNVDFSNVTIDVTGPSYKDLETFNTHFGGRSIDGNQDQHLRNSGRIIVNASNDVNLGGTNGSRGGNNPDDPNDPDRTSDNGSVTMIVRGREQDRMSVDEDTAEKIHIIAGNDIKLDSGLVWTYDNNPTESPRSGSDGSPYDGFTTLKLQAGNDIYLQGDIIYAWNQQAGGGAGQEHNDRLMIDFSAGGDIFIDGNILTAGGDFVVQKAVDVDFSGQTINTHSHYGAGSVSITATGEVTLGDLPMFAQDVSDENAIRTPSLDINAGTLSLISDLYTQGGDIFLEAEQLNLDKHRLETGTRITEQGEQRGGNIRLETAETLTLSEIVSAGDITLAGKEGADKFSIIGTDKPFKLNGDLTLNLGKGSANLTNVVNGADGDVVNLKIEGGKSVTLQTDQTIRLGSSELSGDLALTSGADITQEKGTYLKVGKLSRFSVGEGRILLDQEDNIFGSFEGDAFTASAIWLEGEDATEVAITSTQDLLLGQADREMTLSGSLDLQTKGNINQLGIWSLTGKTKLSADDNISLNLENKLTSLSITQAGRADVRNDQALQLAAIDNVGTLDLTVEGDVTQSSDSSLNLESLILSVTGNTTLTNKENKIANLSGNAVAGKIVTNGPLILGDLTKLGDLTVKNDAPFELEVIGENASLYQAAESVLEVQSKTIITASKVVLEETTNISHGATLAFNEVKEFTLSGTVKGVESKMDVNGSDQGGTFTITADASWENVKFHINGSEGVLQGPDLNNTWRIKSNENHQLLSDKGQLTFNGMSQLKGGNRVDTWDHSESRRKVIDLSELPYVSELEDEDIVSGSSSQTLRAPSNTTNTWTIGDRNTISMAPPEKTDDDGGGPEVELRKREIEFQGFTNLQGGSGVDNFRVQLDGQGTNGSIQNYELYGGEGKNSLIITDGTDEWSGAYGVRKNKVSQNEVSQSDRPEFTFSFSKQERIKVGYQGIEDISLEGHLKQMKIRGLSEDDEIQFGAGWWKIEPEEYKRVTYGDGLQGLIVDGNGGSISLAADMNDRPPKAIQFSDSLTLQNGTLSFDDGIELKATNLHLIALQGDIGTETSRLEISVETLKLKDNNGNIYISESDGVTLAEVSGVGDGESIDLKVEKGNLNQHGAITMSSGSLHLSAKSGDIFLENDANEIGAPISLSASGWASVRTQGDLEVGVVSAGNLMLRASGGISSTGAVVVGNETRLVSGGNISLKNDKNNFWRDLSEGDDFWSIPTEENNFGGVSIEAVGGGQVSVNLVDENELKLKRINISGDLEISAQKLLFSDLTNVRALKVNAGEVVVKQLVLVEWDVNFTNKPVEGVWLIHSEHGQIFGVRTLTAADQMIEIETLAEIDPAIFTNVKNYFHQDVSVLLPADQRYDDSGEEDSLAEIDLEFFTDVKNYSYQDVSVQLPLDQL